MTEVTPTPVKRQQPIQQTQRPQKEFSKESIESANAFAARITNNSDSSQGLQIRTSDNDGGQRVLDLQTSTSATGTNYASIFSVENTQFGTVVV